VEGSYEHGNEHSGSIKFWGIPPPDTTVRSTVTIGPNQSPAPHFPVGLCMSNITYAVHFDPQNGDLRNVGNTAHVQTVQRLKQRINKQQANPGKKNAKLSVCLINYASCHEGVWGNGCISPQFLTSAIHRWR
jgi:hypothetical protein